MINAMIVSRLHNSRNFDFARDDAPGWELENFNTLSRYRIYVVFYRRKTHVEKSVDSYE